MEITGKNKDEMTRSFYDELIEGIAHNDSVVQDLKLRSMTVRAIECLIPLLIKWNSNLKLVNLSISKNDTHFCREEKQCCEFYRSLSTFLSKNSSLRQIIISPPFDDCHLGRCMDTIQSALDQNSTLEEFNIRDKLVFQRNKHTSKPELVKGRKFIHSHSLANQCEEGDASHCHPIAVPQHIVEMSSVVPQVRHSNIQTQYRIPSGNSESLCIDGDADFFQAPPAKRQRVGNSSKESSCRATLIHMPPERNPQWPQPPMHNIHPTVMPYPMTYQQPDFPHYHTNPSFSQNYQSTIPYYSHFHTGLNPTRNTLPAIPPYLFAPAQTGVMLPINLSLAAGQYRPATAPPVPVQTIYNPNTGGASTTSADHLPSPLLTTSTST